MGSSSEAKTPELAYRSLASDLSQGDILAGIPWGLVESPLIVCRKAGGGKPGTSIALPATDVAHAFAKRPKESIHAQAELGFGIVLWHDCEIDKFKEQGREPSRWFAATAPVLPLTNFQSEAERDRVRQADRRMYFHLPAYEEISLPESYVDLRHIWSIKQQDLAPNRKVGLTSTLLSALHRHLFEFFTHLRAPTELTSSAEALPE